MTTDLEWWERGLCRTVGLPIETWLPGARHTVRGWNRTQQAKIAACKAVCAACPVPGACHAEAMATDGEVAIRAGLTAEDRAAARGGARSNSQIVHGTLSGYRKHYRRGEPACDDCRRANSAYERDYRAAGGRTRKTTTTGATA